MAVANTRHCCINCRAVRKQEYMYIVKKNAIRSFWRCLDCDSNRKCSLTFNGVRYAALLITYNP
jgi:hypothetical protein